MGDSGGYGRYVRTDSGSPGGRPPLTKRMRPRHWAALDYTTGVIIAAVLFASIRRSLGQAFPTPGTVHYFPLPMTGGLALLLVAVAGIAVALRRRRPTFMLGVLLVSSLVATALTSPDSDSLVFFLPVAYVLYLVAATYERRRDAVRALAAVFVALLADVALLVIGWGALAKVSGAVSVALCVTIAWTAGYTVRQRRKYAVTLQEEAASKAVTQERLRIARELHDVVAHSMSVIAVQAGYGQYVIDTQPGDARAALGAIQATSREALDEMRRMLGALRQADEKDHRDGAGRADGPAGRDETRTRGSESAPLLPAPGLGDLDRLVLRTASAGVRVELTRYGQPRELPPSIDLSAYRVVQEALTNVVKHARTSSCRVMIGYRPDELTLEITDNGAGLETMAGAGLELMAGAETSPHGRTVPAGRPVFNGGTTDGGAAVLNVRAVPAGSATEVLDRNGARGGDGARSGSGARGGNGHGIIGMRERVTLLGGEFSAGPLPGYGFRVSARIPLPSGPAS